MAAAVVLKPIVVEQLSQLVFVLVVVCLMHLMLKSVDLLMPVQFELNLIDLKIDFELTVELV